MNQRLSGLLIMTALWAVLSAVVQAQDTSLSYQGELLDGGTPAQGLYDFQIELFDSSQGGSPLALANLLGGIAVADGLFTVYPDFGPIIFVAAELWLEIAVRRSGDPSFTLLQPRQMLAQTPRAGFAQAVGPGGVDGSSLLGSSVRSAELPIGAVSSADILDASIRAMDIDTASVQRSVSQDCFGRGWIRQVAENGNVICQLDQGVRVFFNPGSFTAQAENGTVDTQFMRPINENICFLSQVQLRNADNGEEDLFCRIGLTGNGLYFLQAVTESGFDGDAFCQAVCLSYNVDF